MDKSGLCLVKTNGRYRLLFDGNEIGSFRLKNNSFGIVVDGNVLKVHGVNFSGSGTSTPNVIEKGRSVFFGETPLFVDGECINITASDYSSLIAGEVVAGYSRYSSSNIYNIVENVTTASKITYTISGDTIIFSTNATTHKKSDLLYGDIGDVLQQNIEDNTETIVNTDAPMLSVRYFDQVVNVGEHIDLTYHVDTQDMSKTNYDTVGMTFTVEVETATGVVTRKTTYAGIFNISTPLFNSIGETWFSIRCIDSRGVGSATQYFDILVKEQVNENFYTMTDADFDIFTYEGDTYQITPNNNNVQVAFANKAALSALFAKTKNEGYNGIKMYNNQLDNNGKGTFYWVDYHSSNGFGTQTYYKCGWETHRFTTIEEVTFDYIENQGARTKPASSVPVSGMAYGDDETIYIQYGSTYYYIKVYADVIKERGTVKATDVPSGIVPIVVDSLPSVNDEWKIPFRYVYIVINTSKNGDNIMFPNGFTVDLNKSTIAATPCDDLQSGEVINLYRNVDTHIVNGNLSGNYDGYDFHSAEIKLGDQSPSEWLCVMMTRAAKFCSFENLDISNSVGYDCETLSINAFTYMTPTFSVGCIDPQTGDVDISNEGMVVSELMNIKEHYISLGEVAVSKFGVAGYWANSRWCFLSFYDNSGMHIKTVKSKLYYSVKIPSSATKIRISGYGTIEQWEVVAGKGPFVMIHERTKGIKMVNCHWHDTRTAVIGGGEVSGKSYENCTFKNVANESGKYRVTQVLGDMEDSWQWTRFYHFKGCKFLGGVNNTLKIMYCQSLDFEYNEGIRIWNIGGLEDGFVYNNKMYSPYSYGLQMDRNWRCYHPFVLYNGNEIDSLSIDEDTLSIPLAMGNTAIKNRCLYSKLKLKNSTNGTIEYE